MARTSRNGAPANSLDDIDDIDIDDMFAGDGDDLFDGLADDLGLDQMGDITNNLAAAPEEVCTAAAAEEPAPAPAPSVDETIKTRRKTKRKPKSPILLDEEEDDAPMKKKRRTKSITSKKKSSKKDKEKEKEEPKADSSKSKTKLKGIIAPAVQRHASSGPSTPGSGNVAAAGIFGGRQKRGQFALPLSRGSDKQKTKNKSLKAAASVVSSQEPTPPVPTPSSTEKTKQKKEKTSVAPAAPTPAAPSPAASAVLSSTPEPAAPRKPAAFVPPIPQSNFCGLKPSNTMFYPFMPALPAEPSIKNRKQYPAIDRINQAFMAFINNTPNSVKGSNGGAPVSESESIHRLMTEALKDMNPSGAQNTTSAATDDKKLAVSTAIGSLRQTILATEKPKLATDLFAACALLKRQYDFLQQNLANMEQWCKENFSEADYLATYGGPDPLKSLKEAASTENILSKFKKPLIKVKIRCTGFKEPKLSGPLFAFLPPSVVPDPAVVEAKEKKITKKRKSPSAAEPVAIAPVANNIVAAAEKDVVIRTYPELRPAKRRQLMIEHVAHTAKELEAACINRTANFCQAIDRRHNELKKLVDEDEVLVIHTAAMWQYIEKAGYFSDITEETLNDTLRSVWAPEVKHDFSRDIPHSTQPPSGRHKDSKHKLPQEIFLGLQSLLVDETSDNESGEDDDDDIEDDELLLHDNFDELVRPQDHAVASCRLVDLSGLNLEERTYMHLRRVGMLENCLPPDKKLANGLASCHSRGGKDSLGGGAAGEQEADDETLEDVIKRMSTHLLRLNKVNNARASFLESTARTHIFESTARKARADEETALIAKCQQLLKKSKDCKVKTSKPKSAMKDEYALPW